MTIFKYIPRALRVALLNQPIPENWKNGLESSLGRNETEAIENKLDLTRKHNYNMIAALCILIVSGFVIFVLII